MNVNLHKTMNLRLTRSAALLLCAVMALQGIGCTAFFAPRMSVPEAPTEPSANSPVPRELDMISLQRHIIEPPDILLINAIKVVPKPPHKIEPFDGLLVRAAGALVDQPIADIFSVDPEGMIDLGPSYGKVKVVGLTIDACQDAVRRKLVEILEEPEVSVSLAFSSGAQQIVGEHLVGPDGRVNLGTYGSVYVTGMTIEQARDAIELQLSNFLEDPKVIVDIFSYNSKKYYIITQGGGFGDNVVPQPITGNETVLDAIAAVGGISQVSSTKIWIARPAPNGQGCEQILPVNWVDISRGASTATNYQLMPHDRLFIAEDPLVKFDAIVSEIVLTILGLPVVREGNNIMVDGMSLAVAEACSGLRMVTIFGAMALAMVLLAKRPWWDRLIILLSAIPIALLVNVIRIVMTAVLLPLISNEAIQGIIHDWAGFAMMPLAMGLLYLELKFLSSLSLPMESLTETRAGMGAFSTK